MNNFNSLEHAFTQLDESKVTEHQEVIKETPSLPHVVRRGDVDFSPPSARPQPNRRKVQSVEARIDALVNEYAVHVADVMAELGIGENGLAAILLGIIALSGGLLLALAMILPLHPFFSLLLIAAVMTFGLRVALRAWVRHLGATTRQ